MALLLHCAQSCIWLILPILLMNLGLAAKLPKLYQPAFFSAQIPPWLTQAENALRIVIFILPLFMKLQLKSPMEKIGFVLYLCGSALYLLSWLMQIAFARSAWSTSRLGFMAPSYTPIVWLCGIALVGDSLYLPIYWSPCLYIGTAVAFLFFHNLHTWHVYTRSVKTSGNTFTR